MKEELCAGSFPCIVSAPEVHEVEGWCRPPCYIRVNVQNLANADIYMGMLCISENLCEFLQRDIHLPPFQTYASECQ